MDNKERLRVLDKLIREGYNTDKKIIDLKVENLIEMIFEIET